MQWFISFPNEPNHPLHEKMIDFATVIDIVRGDSPTQLKQMSKIFHMMMRYSENKAISFLSRFPKIFWAPEIQPHNLIYYTIREIEMFAGIKKNAVAWWKQNDGKVVFFIPEKYRCGNLVKTGQEFNLFYDENAHFQKGKWRELNTLPISDELTANNIKNEKTYEFNTILRTNLNLSYSWHHDALYNQVKWLKNSFPKYLNDDVSMYRHSNTFYELKKNHLEIGILTIVEYRIYITIWPDSSVDENTIFKMPLTELSEIADRDQILLIYTNAL